MSDTPSLPPGTLLANKFRIERLLGAGAMGAVYAIHHELTRHKRALKLLHPSVRSVPDIVRRFLNEASAAGRAGNPHLVETFDAGTLPSGEPYVVMELLEGETLSSLLERERRLDAGQAAELVAQAAEGIEAAHGAGIIHRDLKPENLFVTNRDGRAFVKILDFGVSKFATASAGGMSNTRAGMIYGSPAYMSPEQLMGSADIDPRTDVFSLGIVLYQSVTGTLPFDAPTLEALTMRVLAGAPTPIETLRPDLPRAFVDVVRCALSPARDARFPSARALAEALAPFRQRAAVSGAPLLGLADTVHSLPPVFAASETPNAARSRTLVLWGLAALVALVVLATTLLRSQPKASASTQSAAPMADRAAPTGPALAPSLTVSPMAPSGLGQIESAPAASPERVAKPPAVAIKSQKPSAEAAAPAPAPALSAGAHPSTAAENLGIHQDNPFR
jgi:serine/threonine protein kinase